jgi:hypothetical protein
MYWSSNAAISDFALTLESDFETMKASRKAIGMAKSAGWV